MNIYIHTHIHMSVCLLALSTQSEYRQCPSCSVGWISHVVQRFLLKYINKCSIYNEQKCLLCLGQLSWQASDLIRRYSRDKKCLDCSLVYHIQENMTIGKQHQVDLASSCSTCPKCLLFLAPCLRHDFWRPEGWEIILERMTTNMATEIGGRQNLLTCCTYLKVQCWQLSTFSMDSPQLLHIKFVN